MHCVVGLPSQSPLLQYGKVQSIKIFLIQLKIVKQLIANYILRFTKRNLKVVSKVDDRKIEIQDLSDEPRR